MTVERTVNKFADKLLNKLENKTAIIGVIGLGYVGLPLAVEKAKAGYDVIGFDIQQKRVNQVNEGINYIGDVVDEELVDIVNQKKLKATTDYTLIANVDVVAICVPTPVDIYKQPITSYVESSVSEVAKHLQKGMLIILESTTYPGTTEELLKPILEKSGLTCGNEFFLAYSPERVDPGNKQFNVKNTPKVVGGMTEHCTNIASVLYENVLDGHVHKVSSPAVAEMEKIFENTFRNINIALVNEMAILCNKMGIDVWEVIEAASTKPYGFMPFYPGPGLGGHCIPIDPWYLTWKAREYSYHTRLIETAGEINNDMPHYVLNRVTEILNKEKKALNGSTILVLGVAYKKDIDDCRESPVFPIIEMLDKAGANWTVVDPYVKEFKYKNKLIVPKNEISVEMLKKADIVLIATNHTNFDYELIAHHAKAIFDTRNSSEQLFANENYYKL